MIFENFNFLKICNFIMTIGLWSSTSDRIICTCRLDNYCPHPTHIDRGLMGARAANIAKLPELVQKW